MFNLSHKIDQYSIEMINLSNNSAMFKNNILLFAEKIKLLTEELNIYFDKFF